MKQTDKQTTVRLYVAYTMTLKNIPKPTHSVNFLVLFKQQKKNNKKYCLLLRVLERDYATTATKQQQKQQQQLST